MRMKTFEISEQDIPKELRDFLVNKLVLTSMLEAVGEMPPIPEIEATIAAVEKTPHEHPSGQKCLCVPMLYAYLRLATEMKALAEQPKQG